MTSLGQQKRGRAAILVIAWWIVAAVACVACSKGGDKSDAGVTGGGGGSNAGGGGAAAAGAGGTGTGGVAGSGGRGEAGTSGIAGTGQAGTGNRAGTGQAGGGAAGAGGRPAGSCTFDVQHRPSLAIGTVEIVTWTLDVADLTEARIEFGPSGAAPTVTAPVDLREPMHRTVLVGMKGAKPYTFRIVATDGARTCTSADFSFTTGAVPSTAPKITTTKMMPGTGAKGFIVTSTGVEISSPPGWPDAFIFDTDGDIVWWGPSTNSNGSDIFSRAHLSWDARFLWVMRDNRQIYRVSMDGVTTTDYGNIITRAHHDFAVLPDGGIATMIGITSSTTGQSIVEMKPDGTLTTVADLATLYRPGFYPNSIHYYPADDSYTLGDRSSNTNLYVKFRRNGALVWQLGGANPLGKALRLVGLDPWQINHGHHLTPDGRFLFFNNSTTAGSTEMPRVFELMLDETNNTATKTWEYSFRTAANALGDVERLPNGNALITFSFGSQIQEVDRAGTIVQSFTGTSFGYADFRTSLYGPPPR